MADPGTRFLGRGKPGQREQPAHESLSSRVTLAEVPLTGLSLRLAFHAARPSATQRVAKAPERSARLPDSRQLLGSLSKPLTRKGHPKRRSVKQADNQIPPRNRVPHIRDKKQRQQFVENLERQQNDDNIHAQRRDH